MDYWNSVYRHGDHDAIWWAALWGDCRIRLMEVNDPDGSRKLRFRRMDRDADTIKLCVDYVRVYPKTSELEAKK